MSDLLNPSSESLSASDHTSCIEKRLLLYAYHADGSSLLPSLVIVRENIWGCNGFCFIHRLQSQSILFMFRYIHSLSQVVHSIPSADIKDGQGTPQNACYIFQSFLKYSRPHVSPKKMPSCCMQGKAVIQLTDGTSIRVPWINGLQNLSQGGNSFLPSSGELSEENKDKVRALSQADIPIQQRRGLYNSMGRRFKHPIGLKPGLLQKYLACVSCKKERFNLLKEFIIDEDMPIPQDFDGKYMMQKLVSSTIYSFLRLGCSLRSEVNVEAYFVQPWAYVYKYPTPNVLKYMATATLR